MITYLKGDMLNSPAQVLVNTVNTVGVMGKGIALQFKNKYPEMFRAYQKMCDEKTLDIGKLCIWKKEDKWILLFPTKRHWRNPSKMEYIKEGLDKFQKHANRLGIESIAFPKLGCGNGGLDWEEVRPIMEHYLEPLSIKVYIYIDSLTKEKPEHENITDIEMWLKNNPEFIGFEMLKQDLKQYLNSNKTINTLNGNSFEVKWIEDIIEIDDGKILSFNENVFCEFWNYVRDVGIVNLNDIPMEFQEGLNYMVELLGTLKYVEPVIISKSGKIHDEAISGYQYIGV